MRLHYSDCMVKVDSLAERTGDLKVAQHRVKEQVQYKVAAADCTGIARREEHTVD